VVVSIFFSFFIIVFFCFFLSFLFHSFFSSYIFVCFILFYFISHYLLLLCIFWMIFFIFLFIYCSYYFILMLEFWILGYMTLLYIYLFVFRHCLSTGRGLGMYYPPFTHTHYVHDLSGALYPGLSNFRSRGDCVVVSQWMYFPSGHCENPS